MKIEVYLIYLLRIINHKIGLNMSSDDCGVCCEPYTKELRKKITCPYGDCNWSACKICTRKYLLGTSELAHCMQCRKKWERDFCQKNLNKSYFNGEYKEHRKGLLFDTEKARMPDTMPAVEVYKSIKILEDARRLQKVKVHELRSAYLREKDLQYGIERKLARARRGEAPADETGPKKFIKKCPADGCEGYLSTAWKCGVCNIWVCPDCMEEKGYQKDAEHTCNPDTLASAQLIKTETKPCPTCNVSIFKISGCDQMWCTQCEVAFSWRTGHRINGVIHNPHFYAAQAAAEAGGAGGVVNNPGAVACGGIPMFRRMRDRVRKVFGYELGGFELNAGMNSALEFYGPPPGQHGHQSPAAVLMHVHRGASHFQFTVLDPIRQKLQNNRDNQDLRIKFIIGEITETKMKSQLIARDTKYAKLQAMLHIYELMQIVYTETLITIFNGLGDYIDKCTHLMDEPEAHAIIAAGRRPSSPAPLNCRVKRAAILLAGYAPGPVDHRPEAVLDREKRIRATSSAIKQERDTLVTITKDTIDRLHKIRVYCNKELMKVGVIYGQTVEIITNRFGTQPLNKKESATYLRREDAGEFICKLNRGAVATTRRGMHGRNYVFV